MVAPDDEPAIAAAIEALIVAKQEGRLDGVARHTREVAQRYDIRRTAGAFAEILARCA